LWQVCQGTIEYTEKRHFVPLWGIAMTNSESHADNRDEKFTAPDELPASVPNDPRKVEIEGLQMRATQLENTLGQLPDMVTAQVEKAAKTLVEAEIKAFPIGPPRTRSAVLPRPVCRSSTIGFGIWCGPCGNDVPPLALKKTRC
jgi:hypothetical protein